MYGFSAKLSISRLNILQLSINNIGHFQGCNRTNFGWGRKICSRCPLCSDLYCQRDQNCLWKSRGGKKERFLTVRKTVKKSCLLFDFSYCSSTLEQLKFKLEKKLGFRNLQEKFEKYSASKIVLNFHCLDKCFYSDTGL